MRARRRRPRERDRDGGQPRTMRSRRDEHAWAQGRPGSHPWERGERRAPPDHRAGAHGSRSTAAAADRMSGGSAVAPLSGPVEDYLKAIYDLERVGEPASTNDIALRLAISPASVSGMVRRLADQGLITHEPYRGVRLTTDGRRAALRTLRRHRILDCYLTEVLCYPWDRVHEEAEQLEHAASEELIERMAAALGDPKQDPHGAPIPTRDGRVEESRLHTLAEAG